MKILLEGREKLIGYNLWSALIYFRNEVVDLLHQDATVMHDFNFCIWIDGLCIDQDNIGERNAQVQRMRGIYKKAKQVSIWLGPEGSDSNLAMDLVTDPGRPLNQGPWIQSAVIKEEKWIACTIADNSRKRQWLALKALYKRPYWKGIWIVQEIFSNSSVWVHCGSQSSEYRVFTFIGLFLLKDITDTHPEHPIYSNALAMEVPAAIPNVQLFMERWRYVSPEFSGMPLHDLLKEYGYQECTDPRDKVYSLLGLAPDYFRDESLLPVRYDLPANEIYKFAASFIICEGGRLESVLWHAEHSDRNRFVLPSWTPSWHRPDPRTVPSFASKPAFRADSEQVASPNFYASHSVMSILGQYIGKIEDVVDDHVSMDKLSEVEVGFVLDLISKWLNIVFPHGSRAFEAIINECQKDMGQRGELEEDDQLQLAIGKLKLLYELLFLTNEERQGVFSPLALEEFVDFCINFIRNSRSMESYVEDLGNSEEEIVTATKICFAMCDRVLFMTKICKYHGSNGTERAQTRLAGLNIEGSDMRPQGFAAELHGRTTVEPDLEVVRSEGSQLSTSKDRQDFLPVYGICTPRAKQHDTIVILQGCNVPVILRKDEDETGLFALSSFIGLAYVEGYMYAEAVGKFETQPFRIR